MIITFSSFSLFFCLFLSSRIQAFELENVLYLNYSIYHWNTDLGASHSSLSWTSNNWKMLLCRWAFKDVVYWPSVMQLICWFGAKFGFAVLILQDGSMQTLSFHTLPTWDVRFRNLSNTYPDLNSFWLITYQIGSDIRCTMWPAPLIRQIYKIILIYLNSLPNRYLICISSPIWNLRIIDNNLTELLLDRFLFFLAENNCIHVPFLRNSLVN